MSDKSNALIKTPRQLIIVIVLAFLVPIVGIILLATYVVRSATSGAGSDAMTEQAIAARMQPVGIVAFAEAGAARALQTGEAVYTAACSSCHATGVAGAPRTGHAAAWSARIKQGYDVLVKHAVEGFKAMPPKGGNANLDPIEVARAVAFMANQSGAKFKEPAAPPSAATARAPAAPPAIAAATSTAPPVAAAAAPAAAKGTGKATGAQVYALGCNACHATGVAGAPKLGDKTAWAPRLSYGIDGLTASVIKGKGAMPPRGAVATATDADLRAAVEYMVAAVK
jgi:cytochrome c5